MTIDELNDLAEIGCCVYHDELGKKAKEYIIKIKKENELLKEELTNLKNDITRVYNTMISLETINKEEMEDIEEI